MLLAGLRESRFTHVSDLLVLLVADVEATTSKGREGAAGQTGRQLYHSDLHCGKGERGQHANNGNHDHQLYQAKTILFHIKFPMFNTDWPSS